jgi:hypothetical protein
VKVGGKLSNLLARMKLLGYHMTTERTNRRHEQEFTPKKGRFCWCRKKTGKRHKGMLGREAACKGGRSRE